MFPLFLAVQGGPSLASAALLLLGLLPAVVALDTHRRARLDRAAACLVLISSAVLAGGVLRGLPPAGAALLLGLAVLEALMIARRRRSVFAIGAAGAMGLALAAFTQPLAARAPMIDAAVAVLTLTVVATAIAVLSQHLRSARRAGAPRPPAEIESLMPGVLLSFDAHGRVTDAGPTAGRQLGIPAEHLMGRGIIDLTLVADRPALLRTIADCIGDGGRRSLRFRLRRSVDDALPAYRDVELDLAARAQDGRAIGLLRDASPAVLLDAAPQQRRPAAAERSAYLGAMTHEFRTPLNAVIGFSEILANPASTPHDSGRVQEYARLIHEAGHDLLRMNAALVEITRIESGLYELEVESTDLVVLAESVAEAFCREPAAAGRDVRVVSDAARVMADVDARAFRAILAELIHGVTRHEGHRGAEVRLASTEVGVEASVHPLRREDPAGSAPKAADATEGLGLALVRGLASLHGARASVDAPRGFAGTIALTLRREAPSAPVLNLADIRKKGADTAVAQQKERRRA